MYIFTKAPSFFVLPLLPVTLQSKRLPVLLLLLIVFGMLPLSSYGTSYSWVGSNASTPGWHIATNWNPVGVPGPGDDVTIGSTTGLPLTVTPVMNQSRSVSNFIINSGKLEMGTSTLTITSYAAFTKGEIYGTLDPSTNLTVAGGEIIVNTTGSTTFGSTASSMLIKTKMSVTSGSITLANTTFFMETRLTKNGAILDYSRGNNLFKGTTYLKNLTSQGSNRFLMAYVYGDTFEGDLYLGESGASYGIEMAWNGYNTFSNIIIDSPKGTIIFGGATGHSLLIATKSISVTRFGLGMGQYLTLNNFQQMGTTPQSLDLKGTTGAAGNGSMRMGKGTSFEGDVTIQAASIFLEGCTFHRSAYLNRTRWMSTAFSNGLTPVQQGQVDGLVAANKTKPLTPSPPYTPTPGVLHNYFKGPTLIRSSYNGYGGAIFGGNAKNIFSDELTLLSDAGTQIALSSYGLGDLLQGNVFLNSTSAAGITIGSAGAATILADQKNIAAGNLSLIGYGAGGLTLQNFAQLGTTDQTLLLSGSAYLRLSTGSIFGGKVHLTAPSLFLDGATYQLGGSFIKTGTAVAGSLGGNIFRGKVSMVNQSASDNIFNLATVNEDLIEAPTP